MEKRKTEILQRLVQIRNRIANRETNCRNEINATAFTLKERLCVYGHGVLLKPILNRHIPQMEQEWVFELYNKNHNELKERISAAVKKEEGIEKIEYTEEENGLLRILIDTSPEKEFSIRKVLSLKFAEAEKAVLKMDTVKANLEEIFIELTSAEEEIKEEEEEE